MPNFQETGLDPADNPEYEELPKLTRATTAPTPSQYDPAPLPPIDEPSVSIPLEDVTAPVAEINQPAEVQLTAEVQAKVDAVLRQGPTAPKETVAQYNERVKRDFTEQVMAARHAAAQPPPPPQPVAKAIQDQTAREMAAGAKQSAHWAEQQKTRPAPNAGDIAAAGHTTPVFAPASYSHERGENFAGKEYTKTNLPGR